MLYFLTNKFLPINLQELSEIHSKLDFLVEEVLNIKKVQAAQLGKNTAITNQDDSVSPFLMQYTAIGKVDEEQYRSFRVFY